MEWTIVDGLHALKLDLVFTLALAAVSLFVGYAVQQRVRVLARSSIPAPVIGGLLVALSVFALQVSSAFTVTVDTSLRAPLQIAFFTVIGFSATLSLLRVGGWRMALLWALASATAIMQNVVGIGVARLLGVAAPLGIICGSLTLTGGPATGLAFTELFEGMGISGAGSLIIASATFGILVSSLVGNPTATFLIRRFHLASPRSDNTADRTTEVGRAIHAPEPIHVSSDLTSAAEGRIIETGDTLSGGELLRNLQLILAVMGVGTLLNLGLARVGITLPSFIGPMIIAAVVRNFDDRFGWVKISARATEALGTMALALFLLIALMDLKLWQLAGLALPALIILLVQIVVMILFAVLVTFVSMGRDYEAAVTASAHIGFCLGITPNAVANMEALAERYGPAPRSFLIAPLVGAFFMDFSNALIILFFAKLVR